MAKRTLAPLFRALFCGPAMCLLVLLLLAGPGWAASANATDTAADTTAGSVFAQADNATQAAPDLPTALGHSSETFYNVNASSIPEGLGGSAVSGQFTGPDSGAFNESEPAGDTPAFSWGGYFKGIGLLFLILAALWCVVWFLRRRGALPGMGGLPQNAFSIEAQIALGPKKRILLVRFLNSRLLLGVTDHSITLLKDVREGSDGRDEPENKRVASFAELIEAAGQKNDAS